MADITMCSQTLCPNAGHCYRVQATPNQHWQSVMAFQYTLSGRGVECENYWPMTRTVVTDSTGQVDVTVSRHCICPLDDKPPTTCEPRYAFQDCADAAEERYLHETLTMLQEIYSKAAKPYIDRLVALHSRSLPKMRL